MPDPKKKIMVKMPKAKMSNDEAEGAKEKKAEIANPSLEEKEYKMAPVSRIQQGIEPRDSKGEYHKNMSRIYYKDGTAGDITPKQMEEFRKTEHYANYDKENKAQLAKEESERQSKKKIVLTKVDPN